MIGDEPIRICMDERAVSQNSLTMPASIIRLIDHGMNGVFVASRE